MAIGYSQGGNIFKLNAVLNMSIEKSIEIFSHSGSRQAGWPMNTAAVIRATSLRIAYSRLTSTHSTKCQPHIHDT